MIPSIGLSFRVLDTEPIVNQTAWAMCDITKHGISPVDRKQVTTAIRKHSSHVYGFQATFLSFIFCWSLSSSIQVLAQVCSKSFLHSHKMLKEYRVLINQDIDIRSLKEAHGINFQCPVGEEATNRNSSRGFLPLGPGLVKQDSLNGLPNSSDVPTLHLGDSLMK